MLSLECSHECFRACEREDRTTPTVPSLCGRGPSTRLTPTRTSSTRSPPTSTATSRERLHRRRVVSSCPFVSAAFVRVREIPSPSPMPRKCQVRLQPRRRCCCGSATSTTPSEREPLLRLLRRVPLLRLPSENVYFHNVDYFPYVPKTPALPRRSLFPMCASKPYPLSLYALFSITCHLFYKCHRIMLHCILWVVGY